MGILVTERIEEDEDPVFDVSIDLGHNDGVDMSLSGNPTVMTVDELQVFSLFRRRRLSNIDADGNPLIYALCLERSGRQGGTQVCPETAARHAGMFVVFRRVFLGNRIPVFLGRRLDQGLDLIHEGFRQFDRLDMINLAETDRLCG